MRSVFKGFLGVFAERCKCTDLQSFNIFCPFVTNLRFFMKRSLRLGLDFSRGLENHVEKGGKHLFTVRLNSWGPKKLGKSRVFGKVPGKSLKIATGQSSGEDSVEWKLGGS